MNSECHQTNIPQTDNSSMDCDEFISANCIKVEDSFLSLGVNQGDTLKEVFTRMNSIIKALKYEINTLKNSLDV